MLDQVQNKISEIQSQKEIIQDIANTSDEEPEYLDDCIKSYFENIQWLTAQNEDIISTCDENTVAMVLHEIDVGSKINNTYRNKYKGKNVPFSKFKKYLNKQISREVEGLKPQNQNKTPAPPEKNNKNNGPSFYEATPYGGGGDDDDDLAEINRQIEEQERRERLAAEKGSGMNNYNNSNHDSQNNSRNIPFLEDPYSPKNNHEERDLKARFDQEEAEREKELERERKQLEDFDRQEKLREKENQERIKAEKQLKEKKDRERREQQIQEENNKRDRENHQKRDREENERREKEKIFNEKSNQNTKKDVGFKPRNQEIEENNYRSQNPKLDSESGPVKKTRFEDLEMETKKREEESKKREIEKKVELDKIKDEEGKMKAKLDFWKKEHETIQNIMEKDIEKQRNIDVKKRDLEKFVVNLNLDVKKLEMVNKNSLNEKKDLADELSYLEKDLLTLEKEILKSKNKPVSSNDDEVRNLAKQKIVLQDELRRYELLLNKSKFEYQSLNERYMSEIMPAGFTDGISKIVGNQNNSNNAPIQNQFQDSRKDPQQQNYNQNMAMSSTKGLQSQEYLSGFKERLNIINRDYEGETKTNADYRQSPYPDQKNDRDSQNNYNTGPSPNAVNQNSRGGYHNIFEGVSDYANYSVSGNPDKKFKSKYLNN